MVAQVIGGGVGFWGAITASVDWCEPNYQLTPYIAEPFNTLSSLAMVGVGEFGVYKNDATCWKHWFCFRLISLVGFGSFLFHMTLKYYNQMLDELPMVWTSALVLNLCLEMHFGKLPRWVCPSLFSFTLLVSVATSICTGPYQVAVFRTAFTILELASVVLGAIHYLRLPQRSPLRRVSEVGLLMNVVAVSCWIFDVHRCEVISALYFNPQLHAIWHVTVSFGIYHAILYCVYLHQLRFEKLPPTIRYHWGIIPYIKGCNTA